jgi:hypothetical protein
MAKLFRSTPLTDSDDEEEVEAVVGQVCSSTKDADSTIEKKTKDKTEKKHVSKCHGKVKKSSIEGISKNQIKRIPHRAGLKCIVGGIYEEFRIEAQDYLDDLFFQTLVHTDYRKAKTVTPMWWRDSRVSEGGRTMEKVPFNGGN